MDWTIFSAIVQAIGALATASAVIVALWQIKYSNKKKLKLDFMEKNSAINQYDFNQRYDFVSLNVANIGNRDIVLENWGFKYSEDSMFLVVGDPSNIYYKTIQKPLPIKLELEDKVSLIWETRFFYQSLKEELEKRNINTSSYIQAYVTDSTGKRYFTKINKNVGILLDDLKSLVK